MHLLESEISSVQTSSAASNWHWRKVQNATKWQQHRPEIFSYIVQSVVPPEDATCALCNEEAEIKYDSEFVKNV